MEKNKKATASSIDDVETIDLLDDDEEMKENTVEIIDLDDISKKKKNSATNRCINCECESGLDLRKAPVFCLNFYRVKVKHNQKQEICAECYEATMSCYDNLATSLREGKHLIDQEFPLQNDYVEIDSDEEMDIQKLDEEEERFDDNVQKFINDNLPETLNNLLHEINFKQQVDYACGHLNKQFVEMDENIAELESKHNEIQKLVDKVRNEFYESFRPETSELKPVDLIDNLIITKQPSLVEQEIGCRNTRSKIKPASYSEMNENPQENQPAQLQYELLTKQSDPEQEVQIVATIQDHIRHDLPPKGQIIRPKPVVGETYYTVRMSVYGAWIRAKLADIFPPKDESASGMYRLKFERKTKGMTSVKVVIGKHMAYSNPSPVQLVVGTRVIAVFLDEGALKREAYFSGIIAEPLTLLNKYRYLIFFDDGYAQYVTHDKVRVVTDCSKNVWQDVHPDSQVFMKKYLENYPERPMVKLQPDQIVKTEWNGKWWIARVIRVDGSLAKMYFDADSRSEWIYRGSTRLGPLYLEMQAATNRQEKGVHIPKIHNRKNEPYVEYTRSQMAADPEQQVTALVEIEIETEAGTEAEAEILNAAQNTPRAVARKSTARPPNLPIIGPLPRPPPPSNMVPFLPSQVAQPQSKVVYFTPKQVVPPKVCTPHECTVDCGKLITLPLNALRGYNPLSKPLLCGWYRMVSKFKKNKKHITYRAPCGRAFRSMPELHRYLRLIKSDMSVDMFDFEFWVHCLAEFTVDAAFRNIRDISNGVENVPIPCVNYVDNSKPDFMNYSTKRIPMEGVNLNLSEEFLHGCDCEDDCSDKSKCACWQLTIRETRQLNKRIPEDLIGYTYKRLPDFVTTGIYECNSRCKCGPTCLNRVVQHPLQLKLQLFKTANRGWGIRCLNDIPQGAFICIYAGRLLTDRMANEGGVNYGDEYLAELDYIEVVERQKEGYESDVDEPSSTDTSSKKKSQSLDEEDEDDPTDDDEDENETFLTSLKKRNAEERDKAFVCSVNQVAETQIRTRSRKLVEEDKAKENEKEKDSTDDNSVVISDDDENIREPSRFDPSGETNLDDTYVPKFRSVRKMFGDDEQCYIMDAKDTGNIGRFLNHSCSPNVFVQNVFVDTHDLRFPWVAFFAMCYIRAGTELTWNYNYDVGSVPGKVIFCHCGSSDCRGRLL